MLRKHSSVRNGPARGRSLLAGRRKWVSSVFSVVSVLLLTSAFAWGQAFVNGAIVGTVTDPSGAVIPDVGLTLTNLGTQTTMNTTSDSAGLYRFPNLPPGQYRLDAEKTGFTRLTRGPIQVQVNTTVQINVKMKVGAVTQTVEVKATTPLLQPQTSSLGQVVSQRMTTELPLNGRNPIALVALVPGVVPQGTFGTNPVTQNPFAEGNVQINGGAANQSAAYWDGAPLNAAGYGNLLALVPTQDALQEFKVMTDNLPAQYDRFAGGVMNFVTKSGTNEFHGEAYEFLRNKVLNANNFFNNAAGVPVNAFTQNQFGGNLGGRIIKDKTFFFGSYDGFRLRQGLPLLFTVPTAAQRNGDFSNLRDSQGNLIPIYDPLTTCGVNGNPACQVDAQGNPIYTRQQFAGNIIPSDRIDPSAKILSNLWGMPNTAGQPYTNVNNWAGNASAGGNMNEFIIRMDQNISDKQRIFGRYTLNKFNNLGIDPFKTDTYPLQIGTPENTKTQQAVFDDSYTFSPTLLGDFEISYMRQVYSRTPASLGYNMSQLGPGWASFSNQVNFQTLPVLCVSQITDFCSQETGSTINDTTDDYGVFPHLTWVKGRHTLEFGADLRLSRFGYIQNNDPTGLYQFSQGFTSSGPVTAQGGYGFASYLLGYPSSGLLLTTDAIYAQQIYRAVYVQDKFQATNKLTLNFGLRYDWEGPFSERHNRISTFLGNVTSPLAQKTNLPLRGELVLVDTPLRPSNTGYDMTQPAFAPRFGFGYAVDDKTVIRGGYGIFWLPQSANFFGTVPAWDPINLFYNNVTGSINGGLTPFTQFSNPWPNGILPAPQRSNLNVDSIFEGTSFYANVPNKPLPYAQQWNFDIQRQLPGGFFVDAAYAGSKGTHLTQSTFPIDQLNPKYQSMGDALLNQVPNPFAGLFPVYNPAINGPTVTASQLLLPFPQYTGVSIGAMPAFDSEYNSFQLKAEKRFSSGQTLLVAYTASKLINDGGESITGWLDQGSAGFQNYYNLKGERSLSSYDVPQRLVVSYVLDLPVGTGKRYLAGVHGPVGKLVSGWGVDGMTTYQSGWPLGMTTLNNLTFSGGSRPNYVPSAPGCASSAALSGSAESRLNEWFNVGCFAQPPAFTFGNVSRTEPNVRSDSLTNFDFALYKTTSFGAGERYGVQFRAEFFNLFNTPQFGNPNTTIGYVGAGVVSSQANNPRLIQFALKFMF